MNRHKGILYREWKAPGPKAVMLLVHGLGGHSRRWNFLSEFFLKNNISSYAVELKGFGETIDLKGHVDSLDTYLGDILTLRNMIAQENPGSKIFLLGESMGGLIVFLMAGKKQALFDGIICISPALKSKIRFNVFGYIDIFLSFLTRPKKQYKVDFDSSMCTRDIEYQKIMDSSPNEHRLITSNLLVNIARGQIQATRLRRKISRPLLFLVSGDDVLVDTEETKRLFKNLALKDKTIFIYPEMYHALSIDIGREKVFSDILKWMGERI
ncbi:alpha/beta hydrolase [Candidatus Omnitrophota bacterium]